MDRVRTAPMHGGDAAAIARRYGLDPDEMLDFSANINPAGPPPEVLAALADIAAHPRALESYPDPLGEPLRSAIAARLGLPAASIAIGNGASALIDVALRACEGDACIVPYPAFSEYRRALDAAGMRTVGVPLDSDFRLDRARLESVLRSEGARLLILSNPHNPSGALASRETMLATIALAHACGTQTIVDEAFIDYAPESSVIDAVLHAARPVIVRSLTKFYGMPGVRVGYLAAHPQVARAIQLALPSWPIGQAEMRVAIAALGAEAYAHEALRTNRIERAWLREELVRVGVAVYPSAANFLLCELPCAHDRLSDIGARLAREHRIVVRDARSYQGLEHRPLIRVAVRTREDNQRLIRALGCALAREDA